MGTKTVDGKSRAIEQAQSAPQIDAPAGSPRSEAISSDLAEAKHCAWKLAFFAAAHADWRSDESEKLQAALQELEEFIDKLEADVAESATEPENEDAEYSTLERVSWDALEDSGHLFCHLHVRFPKTWSKERRVKEIEEVVEVIEEELDEEFIIYKAAQGKVN